MNFKYSKTLIQPVNQLSKICSMAWSPNNMRLAVACADRKIYLFDEQGNNKEHFQLRPQELRYMRLYKSYLILKVQN